MKRSVSVTKMIRKAILKGFAFLFLATSCAPAYIPNALFTPDFKEKGDIRVQASVGSPEVSLHTGYAYSDKMALTIGGQLYPGSKNSGNGGFMLESGLVYFNNQGNYHYDIMAGAGYAETRHNQQITTWFTATEREDIVRADFSRLYFQYGIHFPAKPFTFSFVSRLSNLYFFTYNEYLWPDGGINDRYLSNIYGMFLEPNLNISVDLGRVSLFSQTGLVLPIAGPGTDIETQLFTFNIGFRLNFNALRK